MELSSKELSRVHPRRYCNAKPCIAYIVIADRYDSCIRVASPSSVCESAMLVVFLAVNGVRMSFGSEPTRIHLIIYRILVFSARKYAR